MALYKATSALYAVYQSACNDLLSQDPDIKHKAQKDCFTANHYQAAERLVAIPLENEEEKHEAQLALREAARELDRCEERYGSSYESEWLALNARMQDCFETFFTMLGTLKVPQDTENHHTTPIDGIEDLDSETHIPNTRQATTNDSDSTARREDGESIFVERTTR
jgi:hypothetical protein